MSVQKPFEFTTTLPVAMETRGAFLMLLMVHCNMTKSMLQSKTITHALLQSYATIVSAGILLLFLFCVVAVLQIRLTRSAGHWVQHRASMIETGNSRPHRTSTSAAELYYLRHNRACAAAAVGNKGGHPGSSCALQISGAGLIAVFLQSICEKALCYFTLAMKLVSLLLARMLQSICEKASCYFTLAMKLVSLLLAMLQGTLEIAQEVALTWFTPLELAACLHLARTPIHQDHCFLQCEQNGCWVSASPRPSIQDMSTTAIALFTLLLALMEWHVPRKIPWQQLTCRILTAICMHALRSETACVVMALLLPTFGKKSQAQGITPMKRTATTSHATEQTEVAAMTPSTELCDHQGHVATEPVLPQPTVNTGSTQEQTSLPLLNRLDDVISVIGPHAGEGDAFRTLHLEAERLRNAKQDEIRELCKAWGLTLTEKNLQGKYRRRLDAVLKRDIEQKMIERARELQKQLGIAIHSTATEHARADFSLEDAVAEVLHRLEDRSNDADIMARIVDHACHSQNCISHRVAAMCREANWHTSTELCNDQPLDACGYIAADAVCRLRDAALGEGSSWHDILLPDYAQLECIDRGNKVLRKTDDDRKLDCDQVNTLVRHYSHLHERRGAAEEWWGGAVGLDHFLIGLPTFVEELSTTTSDRQHRWRAWVVNTQTSAHPGSHWFTVVVGAKMQLLQSIGIPTDPNTNNYPNLFDSPDPALSNALRWAQAHAMKPQVASWLHACSQWDSAVANKEYRHQKKRRKLCKDHGIPCTKIVDSNAKLNAAMEYIRRELSNRIEQIRGTRTSLQCLLQGKASFPPRGYHIQKRGASADAACHPPRKKAEVGASKLENYFESRATGDSLPEIDALDIPDVATDVRSTYLRLQTKRDIYAKDTDFHIVKNALSELRGYVGEKRLRKMITDPPKTPKTIRQHFKESNFGTLAFSFSQSSAAAGGAQQSQGERHKVDHSHAWRTYYVKLLVLAQARPWLSATERLDPIEDAPPTPKTNFQLAEAIKRPKSAGFAPFGCDFEDAGAYSPMETRLLLYAEIRNYDDHDYGTFTTPREMMPYTYPAVGISSFFFSKISDCQPAKTATRESLEALGIEKSNYLGRDLPLEGP